LTPCIRDLIPLDIDVSPFDNSNTKKEGVSRSYKGCDGYAPIFSYLGQEGYCINTQLREGKTHCQKGTAEYIDKTIRYAKGITDSSLLLRLDSGNDSADNIKICVSPETKADFIIKRNLRKESLSMWLSVAREKEICCQEREGKKVYMGEIFSTIKKVGQRIRMIFHVIERTITADGQILIEPDIKVDTYWTSLPDPAYKIIELYHSHGTSEQFHSELKTDLDLERLPSGKFASNSLILHLGIMAYNILRLIGQESIKKTDTPIKNNVTCRRIKTVIQNFITIASKLANHARKLWLKFGRHSPWFAAFNRIYEVFA
jgi:hypothetical protein